MGLTRLTGLYAGFLGLPVGRMNRESIARAQLAALRRRLAWAKERSPFYRDRLTGVEPDRLTDLADLAKLPFTRPADLADRPQDLLCLSQSEVARVITIHSSGSSGPAKRVFFTEPELADTADFFRLGLEDLLGPDAPVTALLPYDTPDGAGHLLGRALRAGGRTCHLVWPVDDMNKIADQVRGREPGCLVGLPVHLLNLAERIGPDAAKAALFCSEYTPVSLRRRVEAALKAPSHVHYGSTETGLGGAVDCDFSQGCHVRADILWETVEPGGDRACRSGEAGELVITTLRRRAMPLIRYRTGDLVTLSDQPCPCGEPGPRLVRLGGRLAGPGLADGTVVRQAELDEALFALPGLADFRVYLDRGRGREDALTVEYVPTRPGLDLEPEIVDTLAGLETLSPALESGGLALARPQAADKLAASHTIKRVVVDRRGRRSPDQGAFP